MATTEKRTVIIDLQLEGDDATKQLSKFNKEVEKTAESTDEAAEATADYSGALGSLDGQLGGVLSGLKGAQVLVKGLTGGFKTLRGAIIATGIGALVITLGSLFTWFNRTREGSEKLNKIMGFLGAGVDVILDLFGDLGETMFNAFSQPQEALKKLGDFLQDQLINRVVGLIELLPALATAVGLLFEGEFAKAGEVAVNAIGKVTLGIEDTVETFTDLGKAAIKVFNEIAEETQKGSDLAERENNLSRQRLAFKVEEQKLEADIAKSKALSEDKTKGLLSQLEANAEAERLTQVLFQRKLALQAAEVAILEEKNALGDSSIEQEEELAELQAEFFAFQKEGEERSIEFLTKRQGFIDEYNASLEEQQAILDEAEGKLVERNKAALDGIKELTIARRQSDAEEIEDAQLRFDELVRLREDQLQRELEIADDNYLEQLLAKKEFDEDFLDLQKELDKKLLEEAEKAAKEKEDADKEKAETTANLALDSANQIVGVTNALFGASKETAIAQAAIDTALAILAANKLGPPASIPAMIFAAATGAIQLATILATPPPKLPSFATGGMLSGRKHSQGGIMVNAEHGEAILNANSMSDPYLRGIASMINVAGGGVPFMADGGLVGITEAQNILNNTISSVAEQQVVLVIEDLDAVQNRVAVTESISTL